MRGKESDQVIAHHSQRLLCFWIAQKPLLAETRLNRHIAAITEPDIVFVRLRFRKRSTLLQQLLCLFPRFEPLEPIQLRNCRTIDAAVRVQHIDNRQVMALADLKIQRVMRRRNFQNTSAEFRIDCFVSNNWNFLTRQRTPRVLAQRSAYRLSPG